MKRGARFLAGAALTIVCAAGVVHGVRAGLAQAMYLYARYGSARDDAQRILALCTRADRLYPFNPAFCRWAAEQAYYASDGLHRAFERETATHWCDRGIALDPYDRELRILRTRLLQHTSPAEAAAYWARYVDWQFWEPYNHALLLELRAQAGDIEGAMDEMAWVRKTPYEAESSVRLLEAWDRVKRFTPAAGIAPAPPPR